MNEFEDKTKNLKVAVVHDWIFVRRGGEKVLENILNLFPHAHLFYLFGNPGKVLKLSNRHKFFPSFLNQIPFISKLYKLFLPMLPVAIESLDLQEYDLVVSSSSCVAKGVICSPKAKHVSYLHSPMRYAWDQEHKYFKEKVSLFNPLELLRRIFLSRLRVWDVTSSARVDLLLANSAFVGRRCKLYYGRDASVLYPPVELERFMNLKHRTQMGKKILLFGAWTPYKQMGHALELLLKEKIPVIAAGQGEELEELSRKHSKNELVEFHIKPSDKDFEDVLERSHALLFPAIEDFGIVPVECMAAGVPVVAPRYGGTGETVVDGITGITFEEGNDVSLVNAVKEVLSKDFSPAELKQQASKFSTEQFQSHFKKHVVEVLSR